jgi:CBS domain-containing protein
MGNSIPTNKRVLKTWFADLFSNVPIFRRGWPKPGARPVKDIMEPPNTILSNVSVKAALDEMHARGVDSSPVTDQRGELLGIVSKNELNRKVGGKGHDPKTEPVKAQVEKNTAYCLEDQTVAGAEQIMLKAQIGEVPVVTCEKLVVGTTSLEAIAQERRRRKTWKL